jgi:aldose 1-epimerase
MKAEVVGNRAEMVTEFDSSRHDDVLRQFRHPFLLRMNFVIEGNVVRKKAEIVNKRYRSLSFRVWISTSFLFPEGQLWDVGNRRRLGRNP